MTTSKVVQLLNLLVIILMGSVSCTHPEKDAQTVQEVYTIPNPEFEKKPNIIWIVAEDQSANFPFYGDTTIETPTLSKLASEGVCYDNFYTPHPVCAPARAAIITGMYANSIGASHMRTGPWYGNKPPKDPASSYKDALPEGIAPYEAVPPPEVKMFTEYLRKEGYYCSNNSKEDYQFLKTPVAWDESGKEAHWRKRAADQPFFAVFNLGVTHESRIWSKQQDSLWVAQDLDPPIPPYLPDTEIAKQDLRRMYSNIKEMDAQVGAILDELKADGLLENTIIVWYTDHGGPLPRQKRMLYDSGIKVPMIIRFPNAQFGGERDDRLISFIDLAPTMLSLASIKPLEHMQGKAFLGTYIRSKEPEYIFGAADRFDEKTDRIRSVRDQRYKYIKYYHPERPMFLEVAYRNQMPVMQELLRLREEGKLTAAQQLWFREHKPQEELFDLWKDPYELHDLSNNPEQQERLVMMRAACNDWTTEINDTGLMEEEELINQIWSGQEQPVTARVLVQKTERGITLSCETQGASIGYKILSSDTDPESIPYQIYNNQPLLLEENQRLLVTAHRLGFKQSDEQKVAYRDIPEA